MITIAAAVNAYAAEAVEQGKRSNAWRSFAREVSDRWGADFPLQAIGDEEIAAWVADMVARQNAAQTIVGKTGFLNSLLRFAGRTLSQNCRQLVRGEAKRQERAKPFPTGPRILTVKELDALKRALAPGDWNIIVLAMKTGATAYELMTLRFVDLNFTAGLIKVTGDSNGVVREVPMVTDVRRILAKASKTSKTRKAYVLTPRGYSHWTNRRSMGENWKHLVFRPALQQAKIKNFTWRDFRAMAATKMLEAGVPRTVVAEVFGLKSCRRLERYVNPHGKLKALAMAVL